MIRTHNLSKTYGSGHTAVTAVDSASFAVDQNEFIALVGPSGSGKTTLLSMVGGLLTPTEGMLEVGGVVRGLEVRCACGELVTVELQVPPAAADPGGAA